MNTVHLLSISQRRLVLPLALSVMLPLAAKSGQASNDEQGDHRGARQERTMVLYDGPLSHDQDWTIKAGPRGPNNQVAQKRGGTCSMVPANVSNVAGFERVVFIAEKGNLGLWKMSWSDTVSGTATDGNKYVYKQQFDYVGVTTDGRPPQPNRAAPVNEAGGFLQQVPSNVAADTLDFDDFFLLVTPSTDVAASSHVRGTFRLQIPPVSLDPPPPAFPNIVLGRYIFSIRNQLAGQLACDPL